MGPAKRQKVSQDNAEAEDAGSPTSASSNPTRSKPETGHGADSDEDGDENDFMTSDDGFGSEESDGDAEDDVAEARRQVEAERKSHKRPRRRAVSPSRFGETLQSLLNTDAPSDLPLSLKPSIARKRKDDKLEGKAKKVLQEETKVKREKNHVADLIGGWGGEGERALRKVAQRGGEAAYIYLP